jgi:hypothetical protein
LQPQISLETSSLLNGALLSEVFLLRKEEIEREYNPGLGQFANAILLLTETPVLNLDGHKAESENLITACF